MAQRYIRLFSQLHIRLHVMLNWCDCNNFLQYPRCLLFFSNPSHAEIQAQFSVGSIFCFRSKHPQSPITSSSASLSTRRAVFTLVASRGTSGAPERSKDSGPEPTFVPLSASFGEPLGFPRNQSNEPLVYLLRCSLPLGYSRGAQMNVFTSSFDRNSAPPS